MKPRDAAIKDLTEAGYEFDRHGKKHDLYVNKNLGVKIPVKRHDFDENDRRYINREIMHNRTHGAE